MYYSGAAFSCGSFSSATDVILSGASQYTLGAVSVIGQFFVDGVMGGNAPILVNSLDGAITSLSIVYGTLTVANGGLSISQYLFLAPGSIIMAQSGVSFFVASSWNNLIGDSSVTVFG